MAVHELAAIIITMTALASYLNYRFIHLPQPIGVTVLSLVLSLVILLSSRWGGAVGWDIQARSFWAHVDLPATILRGMLSFVLFAGALHINVLELFRYRWSIAALATMSVVVSTAIVGGLMYTALHWLGIDVDLYYCLIFGSLISPTDPIAVLSLFKLVEAPKHLELKIAGEALFNDGVSIVCFLIFLKMILGHQASLTAAGISALVMRETVGALLLGSGLGWMVATLMRKVSRFEVSCLLTLALVTGGFVLADSVLHVSGPITMVMAGLSLNYVRRVSSTPIVGIQRLDEFWGILDEIFNSVLFLLIGLEALQVPMDWPHWWAAAVAIPIVLLARYLSIALPVAFAVPAKSFHSAVMIMTWGGLRGAISIALVLQLPNVPQRDVLLAMTYAVVVFSIIVQGLTIKPLMMRLLQSKHSVVS